MRLLSVLLLAVAFILALIFGAQTAPWSWGPALTALAAAVIAAGLAREIRTGAPLLWTCIALAAGWVIHRAWLSPVIDFARADALLVLAVAGVAWVVSGLDPARREMTVLASLLALTVLANAAMAAAQMVRPSLTWPYLVRPIAGPTGFFGHYNYFSNYMLGAGLWLLARALLSRDPRVLRVLYGLCFTAAALLVPASGSRGGTLSLAIGTVTLLGGCLLVSWRLRSRWLPLTGILLPVMLVASGVGGWWMLQEVQSRRQGSGESSLSDNLSRLHWIDLALRTGSHHPWNGGGSRSFSWEGLKHWDAAEFGVSPRQEQFVHNELMQAATDYGWIGAGLIVLACGTLAVGTAGFLASGPEKEEQALHPADAVGTGTLAATVAVLVQSNFSFVFHLLPGTLLLGLCFGSAASLRGRKTATLAAVPVRGAATALALALGLLAVPATLAFREAWPVLYGPRDLALNRPDESAAHLDAAARWMPGFRILEEKGVLLREIALSRRQPPPDASINLKAAAAFDQGRPFHPFHPGLPLNAAIALSEANEVEAANVRFENAIRLQGQLESAYRARFFYALHLYGSWYRRWTQERRAPEALHEFLRARQLLEESIAHHGTHPASPDGKALKAGLDAAISFLTTARVAPQAP